MKKIKKNDNKNEEYSLLHYVEGCSPKLKRFSSSKEMGKFVDEFYKKYPDYMEEYSDNWVDFAITGIKGEVHFFTDGLAVE